jgi:hypothetical protein
MLDEPMATHRSLTINFKIDPSGLKLPVKQGQAITMLNLAAKLLKKCPASSLTINFRHSSAASFSSRSSLPSGES